MLAFLPFLPITKFIRNDRYKWKTPFSCGKNIHKEARNQQPNKYQFSLLNALETLYKAKEEKKQKKQKQKKQKAPDVKNSYSPSLIQPSNLSATSESLAVDTVTSQMKTGNQVFQCPSDSLTHQITRSSSGGIEQCHFSHGWQSNFVVEGNINESCCNLLKIKLEKMSRVINL